VTTVFDTSVVHALLDRTEAHRDGAAAWYRGWRPGPVTTPLVLAETDHLPGSRLGSDAQAAWRHDLAAGGGSSGGRPPSGRPSRSPNATPDLGIGLTDASLVVLAARLGTTAVATFDERHLRALRPRGRRGPSLCSPADA